MNPYKIKILASISYCIHHL